MDEDLLKMSGVSAGSIAVLLLIYRILKELKGKRFISVCCQRKIDIGFDVGTVVTPKEQNNPMIVIDGTSRKHNPERKQTDGQAIQTVEV
jgi:hypothetical protein